MKKLLIAGAALLSACGGNAGEGLTIYTASQIVTMNPDMPTAQAVAVNGEGGIVAVGNFKGLKSQLRGAIIDTQFENKTLIPGLIDPHVHMTLGAMMYSVDFVPPWDMETPKGIVAGLPDKASLLASIADFAAQGEGPLVLFGYHNLVQGDLTRQDLDMVTTDRPLYIWHYSGHDFYLNSAAIIQAKLTPALAEQFEGVGLDKDGELNGRIYEDAGLALFATLGPILLAPDNIARGWNGFESILARSGVTTVADLGYGIFGRATEDAYISAHYQDDPYRLYLVPEHRAFAKEFGAESAAQIKSLAADQTKEAKVLPQIKLFTDAAFYSQTMKMAAPGYIGGQSEGTDGLWVTKPEDLPALMARYWDEGLDIHIHSNGDAAQDNTLSAFAAQKAGGDGQRLIIEHAGLLTPAQIAKAADLGVGLSAASHYVNYMGDDYVEAIGGKTDFITPLNSAAKAGMHVTVHSDAPLAPPNPMKAASVHMTRLTRQGNVSNAAEKLSAQDALRAVTLDAAWSLGLEDEIGSIEAGKRADFTVLGANPMEIPGESWAAIPVWGVVLGGKARAVPSE